MSDKGPRLAGMGPQFEAPSADDNLRRVSNTLRQTVRDQGQVMSLTLSNNALLWEERKGLKQHIKEQASTIAQLQSALTAARKELEALNTPEHRSLHELRQLNEQLSMQVDGLKKALQLHLVEAIDAGELKERLRGLEDQRKELAAAGVQPTELMIEQDKRARAAAARIAAVELDEEVPPTLPG